MKFLKRYYSQLLFLFIGILGGFFISRLPIEFEPKTNWLSLANFFLTVLLALYLEFVVRPSFSNNRNEKDLLIEQLKDIRKEVVCINELYSSMRREPILLPESKAKLITKFRDLSNLIDMFKNADDYCSLTTKSDLSEKLVKMFFKYKKSITGHGFNNSTFHFDRLFWSRHESDYKALLTSITHSILDVNKL